MINTAGLALNLRSSCLSLPTLGVAGMCHCAWFMWCWELNLGFYTCLQALYGQTGDPVDPQLEGYFKHSPPQVFLPFTRLVQLEQYSLGSLCLPNTPRCAGKCHLFYLPKYRQSLSKLTVNPPLWTACKPACVGRVCRQHVDLRMWGGHHLR